MYYAYVLKSTNHDYFYKGHCRDLEKRLAQHNSGMTESIRPYIPFEIIYKEEFATELKQLRGKNILKPQRAEGI